VRGVTYGTFAETELGLFPGLNQVSNGRLGCKVEIRVAKEFTRRDTCYGWCGLYWQPRR
jgi:hypothetical protein